MLIVAKLNCVNPLPRACTLLLKVTKTVTMLTIHHAKDTKRKKTVSRRKFRTIRRLYGVIETASSSVVISLVRSSACSESVVRRGADSCPSTERAMTNDSKVLFERLMILVDPRDEAEWRDFA